MKMVITGRAGSGKTAVATELKQRGYDAFDTDNIPNLSNWFNVNTGERVTITGNTYVDRSRYSWAWDTATLRQLLDTHDNIFICGGADNDFDFDDWFDRHFVLSIEPELQIEHLQNRTNNDYGKDPRMFHTITEQQAAHISTGRARGAIVIDASKPITAVVDDILANYHDS
jgi:adenylate kinase family enzyme